MNKGGEHTKLQYGYFSGVWSASASQGLLKVYRVFSIVQTTNL